jgi:RNA polymerase sigma factor (sigma-70 family)
LAVDSDIRDSVRAGALERATTLAIRRFGPEILGRLRLRLGEDDVKEAFSRWAENVWQGLARFGWRSSLRTWVHRVARNASLDLRREAWRRRERPFLTGEASRIVEEVRSSTLARDERRRRELEQLRASLTPAERRLLDLRVNQGLSWAEIAAVLSEGGEPSQPAALMKRFDRLKRRLGRRARALRRAG